MPNTMNDVLSLNGSSSRTAHIVKEKEAKRIEENRLQILYLIAAFFEDCGYANSHQALWKEAQLTKDIQICDNIDLETILQEYTQYYYSKFNKYPKICRKQENSSNESIENNRRRKDKSKTKNCNKSGGSNASNNSQAQQESCTVEETPFDFTVTQLFPNEKQDPKNKENEGTWVVNHKSLKPIGGLYPIDSEWYEIAKAISMEMVSQKLNVRWHDIVGQEDAKDILKHSILYPLKYPELFGGKFSPPKGVLLYGPPGTGKTMLAKAVATECECTFFNITSSSVTSKWRGDSEKYVRVLFELAKYYAPTVIFLDEVDWISYTSDSEPSKRFRAEFLTRLDGLLSSDESGVTILAATNVIDSIDAALLRRLGRRVKVDLPDQNDRRNLLVSYLSDIVLCYLTDMNIDSYSYADLILVCKEAWRLQTKKYLDDVDKKKISIKNIPQVINDPDIFKAALCFVKPTCK